MKAWQNEAIAETWSEGQREALYRERREIMRQADDSADKVISFEEIDEGSTELRRTASYLLVQEGELQPDMDGALKLTASGIRWAGGIRALSPQRVEL